MPARFLLLAACLAAAPAGGGTLRLEVPSPVPAGPLAARVLDPAGGLAAVVRAGASVELPAGTYRVELMTDPPLVRRALVVPAAGEVVARFAELGALRVRVDGPDGEPLATAADAFLPDGRKVATFATGETVLLGAGTYKVVVRTLPNRTFHAVTIGAGETEELRFGLGAALRLDARGPGGARVAVTGRLATADGRTLGLASGESLALPAGSYTVVVDTLPETRRSVTLEPGGDGVVRIDGLATLRLALGGTGRAAADCAVTVLEPESGRVLGRARNGDTLVVRPGELRVRFETEPPRLERVRVKAGQARTVPAAGSK